MKDQFIKERIEEFERAFEHADMSHDVSKISILTWLSGTLSQAYSAGEMAMLEKVEEILPKGKLTINSLKKVTVDMAMSFGYNDYRDELLIELKKLKEKI